MIDSDCIRRLARRVADGLAANGLESVFLGEVDDLAKFVAEQKKEANRKVRRALRDELSLAYLCIITTAMFFLAFPGLFGHCCKEDCPQWQKRFSFVTNAFLLQLINTGLSVLRLVEDGLDNAARVLTRSAIELSWQALICLAKEEYLVIWLEGNSPEASRKSWNRLFRGRTSRLLTEIENTVGVPDEWSKHWHNARVSTHGFYSQAVHHSFAATAFGSVAFNLENPEVSDGLMLFGAASDSLRTPLRAITDMYLYFLGLFPRIVEDIRGYPIHVGERFWKRAKSLVVVCCMIQLALYAQREAEQRPPAEPEKDPAC